VAERSAATAASSGIGDATGLLLAQRGNRGSVQYLAEQNVFETLRRLDAQIDF
jgi:hypothetical protein